MRIYELFDSEKVKKMKTMIIIMAFCVLFFLFLESKNLFSFLLPSSKLWINEVMSSNQGAYVDEEGNCYDWIELYNGEDYDISLKGYSLHDGNIRNEYVFSDITIPSHDYLILYLTGKDLAKEGDLYVPFAIDKNQEETLTLVDNHGLVVDSITVQPMAKNHVLARVGDEYVVSKEFTPGYENNQIGYMHYLKNMEREEGPLTITEFLPHNQGIYQTDGNFYDYIEIYNSSSEDVSLKDYYLSNNLNTPHLWNLPDIVLKPGEYYLVYASNLEKTNHASFSLDKDQGLILLSYKNKVIDYVTYESAQAGKAFIKNGDIFEQTYDITPGYANTLAGRNEFLKEEKNPEGLMINEVMTSNDQYLKQKDGNYYDWIELYNNSSEDISLSDYFISTNRKDTKRYRLPDRTLKAHQTMILIASTELLSKNASYPQVNFQLSSYETVFLFQDEKVVDSLFIPETKQGYSYGRGASYGYYHFSKPTPNAKNQSGTPLMSHMPVFSIEPGIYQDVQTLSIELKGSGTIYYTLDGSVPTTKSKKYTGPIVISKTTVIRAISYESGKVSSEIATGSYIVNENHTLPVVSLSLPQSSFNQVNANIHSMRLVVPVHAELFEKEGTFSVDCGLKLFGGQSRELDKKSYALKFSSKYGESSLRYRVFDNREIVEYETLVLRSGSQDMSGSMMRDELSAALMDMTGTVDTQASKPVILYVNGKYWGIYFIREKIDDDFIASHYNVDKKNTNIVKIEGEVDEGNKKDYQALLNYVQTHDLSVDKNYQYVASKLDIDNYIDYIMGQFYANNIDIRNTRYFNNPNVSNNKLRMIFYDLDYGLRVAPANYITWLLNPSGTGYFSVDNSLIRALMQNQTFKQQFLDIFFYDMKYVWTEEKVMDLYQSFYDTLKPEIKRNQERWGFSYDVWEQNCKQIKTFLKNRQKNMLQIVKNYFHLTDKQVNEYMTKNAFIDSMKRNRDILESEMK